MNEREKVLRLDYDALTKNSVWGEMERYMVDRENSYINQLASNPKIAEPMSAGQLWQEMIREIRKIRAYPERIITSQEE